jgi:hypothetical protein
MAGSARLVRARHERRSDGARRPPRREAGNTRECADELNPSLTTAPPALHERLLAIVRWLAARA